jgi:hypothetical protein
VLASQPQIMHLPQLQTASGTAAQLLQRVAGARQPCGQVLNKFLLPGVQQLRQVLPHASTRSLALSAGPWMECVAVMPDSAWAIGITGRGGATHCSMLALASTLLRPQELQHSGQASSAKHIDLSFGGVNDTRSLLSALVQKQSLRLCKSSPRSADDFTGVAETEEALQCIINTCCA